MDDVAWDDDDFEPESITAKVEDLALQEKFKDEDVEEKVQAPKAKSKPKAAIGNKAVVTPNKLKDTSSGNNAGNGQGEAGAAEGKTRSQEIADAIELYDLANLDNFVPEDDKEYEKLGAMVAFKYLVKYEQDGANYHLMLKQLIRTSISQMSSGDVKDIESCIVAMRNEALKKEKEKTGKGKKAKKKEQLNAGKSGGFAGLDDAEIYDDYVDDYDDDFM